MPKALDSDRQDISVSSVQLQLLCRSSCLSKSRWGLTPAVAPLSVICQILLHTAPDCFQKDLPEQMPFIPLWQACLAERRIICFFFEPKVTKPMTSNAYPLNTSAFWLDAVKGYSASSIPNILYTVIGSDRIHLRILRTVLTFSTGLKAFLKKKISKALCLW